MLQNHATIGEIRKFLVERLAAHYPERETNALVRLIFEHIGHPSPGFMLETDHQPGTGTVKQINEIVQQIPSNRPIQYILGHAWFDGLRITVDERVLIPRPETEEMVHRICKGMKEAPGHILDLGTGSGCIALALKNRFPGAQVTGLDHSDDALAVARKNARLNRLEVEWTAGDFSQRMAAPAGRRFDLIVSNPPYIRNSEKKYMQKNVLEFEPPGSLFVPDEDPLIHYRAISGAAEKILSARGSLWLEINENLGRDTAYLLKIKGFTEVTIYRDIHGKERFIEANK